jgi:hypothetical protein
MYFLATAASKQTALEKLKDIPAEFWLKAGIVVVAIIVAVILLRKLAGANKIIVGIVAFVVVTIIGFNWIYERNEPEWASPVVSKIAQFFPEKNSYDAKQKKP